MMCSRLGYRPFPSVGTMMINVIRSWCFILLRLQSSHLHRGMRISQALPHSLTASRYKLPYRSTVISACVQPCLFHGKSSADSP